MFGYRGVLVLLTIALAILITPVEAKRLPVEGLKKAQQAEKRLAADKPHDAIEILKELDQEYPGYASVSLRIAQIYDKLDELGPALFYYRRYARIAGARTIDEAKARLYTLEQVAGAPEAAKKVSEKLGEATAAYEVPPPEVSRSLASVGPDGSLIEIKGPEDLEALRRLESTSSAVPAQDQIDLPQMDPSAGKISTELAPVDFADENPPQLSESAAPPEELTISSGVETPASGASAGSGRGIAQTTQEFGRPESDFSGTDSQAEQDFSRTRLSVEPAQSAQEAGAVPAGARPGEQTSRPSASKSEPFGDFFQVKPSDSSEVEIELVNQFPNSLLTFAAIPENESRPVNAIMAGGERRTISAAPGTYSIKISVTDRSYPPAMLFTRNLDFNFQAGRRYTRVFQAGN